jgi:hypothetical protein
MLFVLNRFSRSVIAQGALERYSRLVRNDSGMPVSQAETFRVEGKGCGVPPSISRIAREPPQGKRLNGKGKREP